MRLTNPTDDELNAAFAEKVAGWRWWHLAAYTPPHGSLLSPTKDKSLLMRRESDPGRPWVAGKGADVGEITGEAFKFTISADAVLPFVKNQNAAEKWAAEVYIGAGKCSVYFKSANAEADTFPRAAVIALLRANGVEIEFTP